MASIVHPVDLSDQRRHGAGGVSWSSVAHSWIATVDHKKLGLMYIIVALLFFVASGLQAALIRAQLMVPNNNLVSPQTFNQLFTMHGTTMVFFVGMPFIAGLANYLVPLMIGARDMAFPRLNALGFWITLFGGICSTAATSGMRSRRRSARCRMVCLRAVDRAGVLAGIKHRLLDSQHHYQQHRQYDHRDECAGDGALYARAGGMTLARMPLFVWMLCVVSFQILVAMPPLTAAQIMLMLDRFLGAHFFDTRASGDAVLWQHFFWLFGHPEVYILMIPGFASVTEIIPVFSRKPIFGRAAMIGASVSIGFISLGVWAHHMYTVGLPANANIYFAISTMIVGIPTGVKIFNWLATMWGGKIRFDTPMLFCVGFLFQFLLAGLTGIMLAVAPFDWQLGNSYFVVAHFHYTLIGGLLFTLFAAIYYWFPKATGKMLSETLGKWHFWLLVIGFHVTFDPLHFAGLLGMPRRIYTYPAGRGWESMNYIATLGVVIQAAAVLVFVWNVLYSLRSGRKAGNDPWDAWTLEWATTSPPPEYNFESLPVVRSSRPLWDLKHPDDPDWKYE